MLQKSYETQFKSTADERFTVHFYSHSLLVKSQNAMRNTK